MLTPLTESQSKFVSDMFEWCVEMCENGEHYIPVEEFKDNLKKARMALALLTGDRKKLNAKK